MSIKDQVEKLKQEIRKKVEKSIDKKLFTEIGKLAADIVRSRTGQGIGVNKNDQQYPLEGLKPSTIKNRKRNAKRLSKLTSPGQKKSNLIATGQMLKGIDYKATDKKVDIVIEGGRKFELSGGESTKSNKEVAKNVEKNGRQFFRLADVEQEDIRREVTKIIRKNLKKQD